MIVTKATAVPSGRLGLMLERQGVKLNRKKLYRLYQEERMPCASEAAANEHWVRERQW